MSFNTDVTTSYMQVMEATGFYRNGVPTSGVSETSSLVADNKQLEKRIKYNAVINQLNATAIYELSGSPCIYFTELSEADPEPQKLAELHKLAWNHGLAPMLWVITPTKVLLYNCYSQPTQEDESNPNKHLVELFETTEAGLRELKEKASRLEFESGEFWKWEKAKNINRKQRVDSVLIKDLTDTEARLVDELELERSVGQTLLIQSIFIAYLQDRDILSESFFNQLVEVDNFIEVLADKSKTNKLFNWIQKTFNGNLFPLSESEREEIEQRHLNVVRSFIGGNIEISTGQLRIWRAYDFRVIPIELISSIYEKFIYATDTKTAKAQSTHYTPINLVDLVLSEVFKNLDGNAKVLDLACGSGVFLVEALRRLVVKRCIDGETPTRKLIRDTLYQQIYGVDINAKAIQIAAFSLYLTALELDYELDQNLQLSDDLKFQKLIDKNLFASDAFDLEAEFTQVETFAKKEFGAVVGNPPWTKSKTTKSASKYCEIKRPEEGYPNGYPTAYGTPPDQAFLWRIGDFANDLTQIGLILHGKPFFSNHLDAKKAKKELFTRFKPQIILNLSKLYRDNIFPNSEAPAMIFIAKGCRAKDNDYCYFVCPERSLEVRKHGVIEIGAENVTKVSVDGLANNPDMLKVATWGSARDMFLIDEIRNSFPKIVKISGNLPKAGFMVGSKNNDVPKKLCQMKCLPAGEMQRYQIRWQNLGTLKYKKLESPRNPEIYQAPLILVPEKVDSKGVISAFSEEGIVYPRSYSGISFSKSSDDLAHYLNGIINSSLASYFLFMTASSWGVERKKIMTQDLSRLPVPQATEDNENFVSRIIQIEGQLRECRDESIEVKLKKQLDEAVFDLYGLDEMERILVEDMVNMTIKLYMVREKSAAIKKPKSDELVQYAKSLISAIKPFLKTLNERTIVADVINVGNAPLQVVKFSLVSTPGRQETIRILPVQELETVLKSIAEQLSDRIADKIYTRRNLRIYVGEDIYIVKPAKLIYWTRSAGLNDADIILSEQLKANRDSIR